MILKKNILPKKRIFNGDDVDITTPINIDANFKALNITSLKERINLNEQFQKERNQSYRYKIYGNINYISPISNIKKIPTKLTDLFNTSIGDNPVDFSNFKNQFQINVCIIDKLYKVQNTENDYHIVLKRKNILHNSDIFKAGFSKNLFYEDNFQFALNSVFQLNDNEKIVVSDDNKIAIPITDIFIYISYNGNGYVNTFQTYDNILVTNTGVINDSVNNLYGGVYTFVPELYSFTLKSGVINTLTTSKNIVLEDGSSDTVKYQYNPIYKVSLRKLSQFVEKGNINNTGGIPDYAYIISDSTNNIIQTNVYNEINENGDVYCTITEYKNKKIGYDILKINSSDIYKGFVRLRSSDPDEMIPRKLLYNKNKKNYEYHFDKLINDNIFFKITKNNEVLEKGVDYTIQSDTFDKVVFKFQPLLNDNIKIEYSIGENFIWKDLLSNGFIETGGNGVDYPFINGIHYIHENIVFDVVPDITDSFTKKIYEKFEFITNELYNKNNSNPINKQC